MDYALQDLAAKFVYRNPLDLPRISYADIVKNQAEGVYIEPPRARRRFYRKPSVFHDDPDGAGLFPLFQEVVVTYPPVFTVSLRDVRLVGFRSMLSREASDGVFGHVRGGQSELSLEGPVVVLTSAEPDNFGSFLQRKLVKLVNLIEIAPTWRFLIHMPSKTFEQFLELAGVPMERVIPHDLLTIYHISQAIIPGLHTPLALADSETRAFYSALRAKCDGEVCGRRLYVSRRSISAVNPTGRVMLNEAALIARLRALAFDIIEPEHLTATEQIAAFMSADLVVGPSGSGMFNAVFCHPQPS
jgi:hypothetical protein